MVPRGMGNLTWNTAVIFGGIKLDANAWSFWGISPKCLGWQHNSACEGTVILDQPIQKKCSNMKHEFRHKSNLDTGVVVSPEYFALACRKRQSIRKVGI